ncbi:hypothetical protein J5N97_000524, partial [Dioscorea zingiberensis]
EAQLSAYMAESDRIVVQSVLLDGNQLIAKSLARFGVDRMFGVVGIPVTSLANRAVSLGVRFLAFHNEQSAGYAASAYGYLTGRPGVLLTVSGPGCVHGLAGLSNAMANGWPMVMISGSCDQKDFGRGDFQELDQIAAVSAHAGSGRPGGCYLDFPSDVLHQTISDSEAEGLLAGAAERFRKLSEEVVFNVQNSQIEEAASLLRHAERPLIVFGKGAAFARAESALTKLVETTGIPFLPTPMGKGLLPDTHDLAATAARSLAIGKCDVALVVGARLNWLLHFGEPPKWSKDVKFILVDVWQEEIELRKPHLGLVVVPFNFLTPMKIIRDAILGLGSPAPILVSEGANTMDVGRAVLVQTEPRTRLDAGTWGQWGWVLVTALQLLWLLLTGLWLRCGRRFWIWTLVRYQLPVVVIVFNNGGVYGGDRRSPDEINGPYKDDPAPTSFVPSAAYHTLIEAFGGKGYLAGTPEELKSALAESFAARKPAVINVIIDPYAGSESGRLQHKN